MSGLERLRAELGESMAGAGTPLAAADLLCRACVHLLEVDGASISLTYPGSSRGTFGASGELTGRLDQLQFTLGEGPCLDAVRDGAPVLVADLEDPAEQRWPALRQEVLRAGVGALFALPVSAGSTYIGALDLHRRRRGALDERALSGGLWAAQLAALPLLDLMTADVDRDTAALGGGWEQLATLEGFEVSQATGMILAALGVGPTEALVGLRAYACAHGMTASQVAWAVVERRLDPDLGAWPNDDGASAAGVR